MRLTTFLTLLALVLISNYTVRAQQCPQNNTCPPDKPCFIWNKTNMNLQIKDNNSGLAATLGKKGSGHELWCYGIGYEANPYSATWFYTDNGTKTSVILAGSIPGNNCVVLFGKDTSLPISISSGASVCNKQTGSLSKTLPHSSKNKNKQ